MTEQEKKRIRKLWKTYRACKNGKAVNCNDCIGCGDKRGGLETLNARYADIWDNSFD